MNNATTKSKKSLIISALVVLFLVAGAIVYVFNNSKPVANNEVGFSNSNSSFSANPNIINEMTGGNSAASLSQSDEMLMLKPAQTITSASSIANTNNTNVSANSPANPPTIAAKSEEVVATKPVETVSKIGEFKAYNSSELSKAKDGHKVVIFLNASWCPTCQSTVKDINSKLNQIDSRLHILSADYDKETELRKKYGVTIQHTFVEVDSNGNLIQKKTGLKTLEDITNFALAEK